MDQTPGRGYGAARVGEEIREARQRLGWDLADVAANLRIRLPFLIAIEEGRVGDLPGPAYAIGFVRTYASALGLDPEEVSRRFRSESQEVNRKTELAFPAPVPERGVPAGAVVLLGVLLAAGAYVGWYRLSGDRSTPVETVPPVPERLAPLAENVPPSSVPSPQVASVMPSSPLAAPSQAAAMPAPVPPPVPVPMPLAVTPPAPPRPGPNDSRITLRVKADAWVQVRERQGQVLLNRVLRSGETWPVPPNKAQLLLTTGNAAGTELLVDGVLAPPLPGAGNVRRDVLLDPDLIKEGRVTSASSSQSVARPVQPQVPLPQTPSQTQTQ